jgi:hypothetical protein
MLTLLNIDANAKTVKGLEMGFQTAIFYGMPAKGSGYNACANAELAGCDVPCLVFAGRGGIASGTFTTPGGVVVPDNSIQRARLARTLFFFQDQAGFMAQMVTEVKKAIVKATKKGLVPVFRLSGTHDTRWEDIPVGGAANIFELFPDVQFYDYTKLGNRRRALGIPNYHLTFSYSHRPEFAPIVVQALKTYGEKVNFAVVFRGELPETFLGRKVVCGDDTDLRFLDEPGVVVGLTAKGRAKRDTSGFVVG